MTIGKLASAAGVGIDTIRYYEREGLLAEPRRTRANYRLYPPAAVQQLRFIAQAKSLGFSLAEIRDLLRLQTGGTRADVWRIAEGQLAEVRNKLRALRSIESVLSPLISACHGADEVGEACPILDALAAASRITPENDKDGE